MNEKNTLFRDYNHLKALSSNIEVSRDDYQRNLMDLENQVLRGQDLNSEVNGENE